MSIQRDITPQQGVSSFPRPFDVVLGSENPNPLSTAVVLGGQDVYLARLFELFNSEAKRPNADYYQLSISKDVALIGKVRRSPFEDLKVKVRQEYVWNDQGISYARTTWVFAGYLKHKGTIFLPHEATYEPAHCEKELRGVAYQTLLAKAREIKGIQK